MIRGRRGGVRGVRFAELQSMDTVVGLIRAPDVMQDGGRRFWCVMERWTWC